MQRLAMAGGAVLLTLGVVWLAFADRPLATGAATPATEAVALTGGTDPAVTAPAAEPGLAAGPAGPGAPDLPADPAAPAMPGQPLLDVVRLEADATGALAGLMAGTAEPGARLTITVDGQPLAHAVADAGGAFVAFVDLAPSAAPRVIAVAAGEGAVATILVPPVAGLSDGGPDLVALVPVASDLSGAPGTPSAAADPRPEVTALAAPMAAPAEGMPRPVTATARPALAGEAPELAPFGAEPGAALPPLLVSDEAGVRLVPGPAPAMPEGADATAGLTAVVALDTIRYTDRGEVFVGGRAAGPHAVRLYLDNVAVAVDRADAAGLWEVGLPDVPPGLYTLRVDELDDAGAVLSRIESPFQREAPADLAAAFGDWQDVAVKTVQPGHTLWAIARERYGDGVMYVSLFQANRDRIRDPDLIYPGQVFVLPDMAGP
jgi:nucleoid-associated protein YgaU